MVSPSTLTACGKRSLSALTDYVHLPMTFRRGAVKTIHLAKADFLRDLVKMTRELYAIGDFTSNDPDWAILSAKLDGFIQAGLLIEVATRDEIQKAIDQVHWDVLMRHVKHAGNESLVKHQRVQRAKIGMHSIRRPMAGRPRNKRKLISLCSHTSRSSGHVSFCFHCRVA